MSKTRIEVLEILQAELDKTYGKIQAVTAEINEAVSVLSPERFSNRIEFPARRLRDLTDYYLAVVEVYRVMQHEELLPQAIPATIHRYLSQYLNDAVSVSGTTFGKSRAAVLLYQISLDI